MIGFLKVKTIVKKNIKLLYIYTIMLKIKKY